MATLRKNTKNSFGLSPETIALLHSAFSKFPAVDEVRVFGSRAMGNFKPGSDIDLAVFSPGMSYNDLLDLKIAIDDLELLYKIDVLDYKKIDHQELKDHINYVGRTLYKATEV
ncbi:nucleotidyltransferase domain-containing protein [Zunongwangia sp. H14]|uniref:nucleotidyltransferase domain-containing protein n=1 Tax=Zunongwangia sp. H14 TaxID=3240792 RepID=UPI003566F56F